MHTVGIFDEIIAAVEQHEADAVVVEVEEGDVQHWRRFESVDEQDASDVRGFYERAMEDPCEGVYALRMEQWTELGFDV